MFKFHLIFFDWNKFFSRNHVTEKENKPLYNKNLLQNLPIYTTVTMLGRIISRRENADTLAK